MIDKATSTGSAVGDARNGFKSTASVNKGSAVLAVAAAADAVDAANAAPGTSDADAVKVIVDPGTNVELPGGAVNATEGA